MTRERQELLHFRELGDSITANRVVLPIDGPGFEGNINLSEGHRDWIGTKRLERFDVDGRGDHSHLQPGDVLRLCNRAPAVRDMPKAEVPYAKADDALISKLAEKPCSNRAVAQRVGLARSL